MEALQILLAENLRVKLAMDSADLKAEKIRVSGTKEESQQAWWEAQWSAAIERAKIRLEKAEVALAQMDKWEDRSAFLDADMEMRVAKDELIKLEKKVADGISGLERELAAINAKVKAIHH